MLHRFHERFGTAGLLIAIVALVAALGGTALAAGALTGKQKKEVEKIAKKFAGKPGAPGAAGINGTNGKDGAEGKQGPAGKDGAPGKDGTNGAPGTPGKSVTVTPIGEGETACDGEGGATLEEEGEPLSETEVCNGSEGSPWAAGGTLPPGSTETGSWAVSGTPADGKAYGPLPFPIPLSAGIEEGHVHFVTEAEIFAQSNAFCKAVNPGTVASLGRAPAPGELCVYEGGSSENATFGDILALDMVSPGASKSGAALSFTFSAPGYVGGYFAVTGCSNELPDGDPNKCPA